MSDDNHRSIEERFIPPVSGIDLEQALNYVDETGLDLEWFYASYTYPRVFYRKGNRPLLDEIIDQLCADNDILLFHKCVEAVYDRIVHFSQLGYVGRMGRGMSEEELLGSGCGWCNEQARVLAALTQAAGLPSRLVFADDGAGAGHVITEVYIRGKWALVDQTEGFIFSDKHGTPVNVLDLRQDTALWHQVDTLYKARLLEHRARITTAAGKAFWDCWVPYGCFDHPLDVLRHVGYCNYFIH